MWSKTRQALESRLCEELKNRVQFHYDVYRTNKDKEKRWWTSEMRVFSILVDSKTWFATNPNYYTELYRSTAAWNVTDESRNEVIRKFGLVPATECGHSDDIMLCVHRFLNELSFEQSLTHENYFIRLLALLDGRLGKRKIKSLVDNVENEPEWFRKWILLRVNTKPQKEQSP